MLTRIQKWGNSLALRIPKRLADQIGLQPNMPVEIVVTEGKLTIEVQPEPPETWAFDLCGSWDDPRPAEEIVAEIIAARTPGREFSL